MEWIGLVGELLVGLGGLWWKIGSDLRALRKREREIVG